MRSSEVSFGGSIYTHSFEVLRRPLEVGLVSCLVLVGRVVAYLETGAAHHVLCFLEVDCRLVLNGVLRVLRLER